MQRISSVLDYRHECVWVDWHLPQPEPSGTRRPGATRMSDCASPGLGRALGKGGLDNCPGVDITSLANKSPLHMPSDSGQDTICGCTTEISLVNEMGSQQRMFPGGSPTVCQSANLSLQDTTPRPGSRGTCPWRSHHMSEHPLMHLCVWGCGGDGRWVMEWLIVL